MYLVSCGGAELLCALYDSSSSASGAAAAAAGVCAGTPLQGGEPGAAACV